MNRDIVCMPSKNMIALLTACLFAATVATACDDRDNDDDDDEATAEATALVTRGPTPSSGGSEPTRSPNTVDVSMNEYAFGLDRAAITSAPDLAFALSNVGSVDHEFVLAMIPADADIQTIINEEDLSTVGATIAASSDPVSPGEDATVTLEQPLQPGRYVVICRLPEMNDPETTHAQLGMVEETAVD